MKSILFLWLNGLTSPLITGSFEKRAPRERGTLVSGLPRHSHLSSLLIRRVYKAARVTPVGGIPNLRARVTLVGGLPNLRARVTPVGGLPNLRARVTPVGGLPNLRARVTLVGRLTFSL